MSELPPHMYDYIKKKVNMADFLSTEVGCNLNWYEPETCAACICPMPGHEGEKKPSFRLNFMEDTGVWIFHCFGCGSKGNIISFCKEYYALPTYYDAAVFLCNKFGFKDTDGMVLDSLKDIKKKMNLQKKMNCTHVIVSHQCLALLRKNYSNSKWVKEAYVRMNKALDLNDIETIESIGFEASKKMGE